MSFVFTEGTNCLTNKGFVIFPVITHSLDHISRININVHSDTALVKSLVKKVLFNDKYVHRGVPDRGGCRVGGLLRGVSVPRGWGVPAPGGVSGPAGACFRGWMGVWSGGGAWWRPPGRLLLRAVRILLECILVCILS